MRMWNVDPKILCNRHLLGEHVEMHMFFGQLCKGKSLKGYIDKGLVEVHNIKKRHDELVEEMKRRGMNHKSPLVVVSELPKIGKVNVKESLKLLLERCEMCRKNYNYNPEDSRENMAKGKPRPMSSHVQNSGLESSGVLGRLKNRSRENE